jgi:cysteine desulfurase
MNKNVIYLDHNATAAMHEDVVRHVSLLLPDPANPSSLHSRGRYSKGLIEGARKSIMRNLNIDQLSHDVIFTSSGTESNNMILKNFSGYHLFISPIEHSSVIKIAEQMSNVTFLKVNEEGVIDEDFLINALKNNKSDNKFVSVGHANSETGIIQDIKRLSEISHEYGAIIHSDMVQSFGKILVDLKDLDVDIVTISSHKIGGMLGAASVVKKAEVGIRPLILGGGQEKGFRSGTENFYAISSFGKAAELIEDSIKQFEDIEKLRDYLEEEIVNFEGSSKVYSKNTRRLPNTSYITMPDVDNQTQMINFDIRGFCVSTGSACSSGVVEKSYVLKSMGFSKEVHNDAIRVSLGLNSTKAEIDKFIDAWKVVHDSVFKKEEEINYG